MKENSQAGTTLGDLFQQSEQQVFRRTDKVFFILFALQWVAGIIFALSVSPRAWSGLTSSIHIHVYAAVVLGALCCWIPMLFIWKLPGHALTRHVVAIGQTGFSSLLIHLSGGRIETHFHVFGSLAFLACYRDWRVLITATVIVAADHLIRGIWFPMSVYGVLLASPWRVAEHALWVVFEDIILIWSCRVSRREMYAICEKEFQNRQLMGGLESKVKERTAELELEVQERRRAESIIRANEERYRTLVENSPQFIVKIDRNYRIDFINRTVEGIDREKVVGTSLLDFHTRDNQEALRRELDGVFQFGQSRSVEVTGPGPSGTVAWYSMNLAPLRTDTKITGAIILATDVTDRRNSEEEMKSARDSAEAGNRAKSEFLAIMSHELRTPLNGVLGFADLLNATPLNTEQREFAGTIRSSGETLLGIINDILDLSKIESGKMDYDIAEVNIREIVEEVTELLMPRAEEKGLELCLWHNPDAPSIIYTDQGRFRQVLLNLVGNAIKFTETGHVLVEIENEGTREAPQLRIGIRDTGIGIPRDKQHLLFQKFSQVDGSSTRKFGGAGLGLAICKQLIEGLSGSIGVESAPGHGSYFWFTHPVEAAALSNPPLPTVPASIDGLRILIVDDLEINRRVLQQQLRRWNIRFETASSGPLGLELLQRAAATNEPFQIALVDHLMPHMDGVMFGQRVKGDPAIAETALIMLTSGAQRGEAREMLNHGFAAYLCKPVVRARQLLESITTVWANLNQARAATPLVENTSPPVTNKILYRVLLAEDNPVNQRVASLHLKRLGCDVICVTNGREAIDQFKKIAFDCVFMDLLMPEIDGLEATKIIRSLPNGSDTLIVAVTANAMSGDRENCLAAGMDDYISKPIRVEELQRVLLKVQRVRSRHWSSDLTATTAQAGCRPFEHMSDPAQVLRDFKPTKEFFIGIDSDGCVFDSMEIKHKECFTPMFIKHFGLQAVSKYAREVWEFVNLYSKTRGANRFPALSRSLNLLRERPQVKARKVNPPDTKALDEWLARETKLGNATLAAEVKNGNQGLAQIKVWSDAVNKMIEQVVHGVPPFPLFCESLEKLGARADAMVISQTPADALEREWLEHGIRKGVKIIAGQEMGTKSEHIKFAAGGKYSPKKILMIGDAPGDFKAAKSNNALFYPIVPGDEEASWERFHNEALKKFLAGTYAGSYEAELVKRFNTSLPENPHWI